MYTRSELQTLAWGYGGHEGYEHTINSHINRLRAKIEVNEARPSCILTVRGKSRYKVLRFLSNCTSSREIDRSGVSGLGLVIFKRILGVRESDMQINSAVNIGTAYSPCRFTELSYNPTKSSLRYQPLVLLFFCDRNSIFP